MNAYRRLFWVLGFSALAIKALSLFPEAVERYYSGGLYLWLSRMQRYLFGSLPFSVGDLLYLALVIGLLYGLLRFLRSAIRQRDLLWATRLIAPSILVMILSTYVLFNALWGLNYNRISITRKLGLEQIAIQDGDIIQLMRQLAHRVNELDSSARAHRMPLSQTEVLFEKTRNAYSHLAASDERFRYAVPSLKTSLFFNLGNYLGYTGYYNPFTGEAQVNTTVPVFVQPFTSCHEIGHQLGYARENEANFAGYLAAKNSPDPAFRYAVYFEMYAYGRPYLHRIDSLLLQRLDSSLNPGILRDRQELERFYQRHENPVERLVDRLYNQYLKANEQPEGKVTYTRVVLWLAAYYKKYGHI